MTIRSRTLRKVKLLFVLKIVLMLIVEQDLPGQHFGFVPGTFVTLSVNIKLPWHNQNRL